MLTKGEFRVGTGFNPSGDGLVDQIKRAAADFIELVEAVPSDRDSTIGNERGRLKALAQTEIESAAMWAVKAATKQEAQVIASGGPKSAVAVADDPFIAAVAQAIGKYRNDQTIHTTLGATEFVAAELRKVGFMSVSGDDIDEAIVAVEKPSA